MSAHSTHTRHTEYGLLAGPLRPDTETAPLALWSRSGRLGGGAGVCKDSAPSAWEETAAPGRARRVPTQDTPSAHFPGSPRAHLSLGKEPGDCLEPPVI